MYRLLFLSIPLTKEIRDLFRYAISEPFDQALEDLINTDATAISTPLDSVPLYTVQPSRVSIILLKSSQAVSSSDRFNLGTPVFHICTRISLTSLTGKNTREPYASV